ncbi:odorant receptor 67c-like [Homalodisca vitripennis]|uniref:odorant receptor 67c-like n=1 Tax=Homalodisca vitripennis TaxID=197043 RepID=UPI001EEB2305|nr:odorant receptor 67c-like [Homalodisca vitripennis]
MPHDSIVILRTAFILVGVLPGDWDVSWKTVTFRAYCVIMDLFFPLFCIFKLLYSIMNKVSGPSLTSFLDEENEAIMALSLTFERFAYRWKSREILEFVTKLGMHQGDGEYEENIIRFYQKITNRMNALFVFLTSVLCTAITANYLSIARLAGLPKFENSCGRFFVDIWVPQVLCRSPWFEITFFYNVFMSGASIVMAYISLVAVPLLAIQIAGKFEIVAQRFQSRLSSLADGTVVGDHLIQKNIKTTIQLHQSRIRIPGEVYNSIRFQTLLQRGKAATLMNSSFHIIVLIKMVFMSLPMIVVSLVMSQTEFGSFQSLIHALYFTLLLFQLFFFCFVGDKLTENSLKVQRAVYNNQWYTMSLANQKLLFTVATRAGRPAKLEVWPNFVPVSLENFLNICQFTYSVYSVLVVTTSK